MENVENLLQQILEVQTGIQQDISGMKNDINSMKSDIGSMKSDIDSMKSDIDSMKSDIDGMKTDIQELKVAQSSMQSDIQDLKGVQLHMKKDLQELKQGQTDIHIDIKKLQSQAGGIINQIVEFKRDFKDFESVNAVRHTEIYTKLDTINDDIEFLKHEEYQTKQDVFKMRKKLEIIK